MAKLGISIYPENSNMNEMKEYVSLAASLGFKRVFTTLLSYDSNTDNTVNKYTEICNFAKDKGMEVIIDVAPSVFEVFKVSYDDLSFFHKLGVSGLRLDESFNGQQEATMTYNPYGLKIEINASQLNKYLANILSYKANREKIVACHNFYPQKYTGLGYDLFKKCNEELKSNNIKIAAFVTSQNSNTFGPKISLEGLCTLEMHRNLPIELQARHLLATNQIDDVIIGNCYATKEEMLSLGKLNPDVLTFRMEPQYDLSEVEKEITYDFPHHIRGDMSDYMARSTFSRIKYKNHSIPAKNTVSQLKRGDIVILNDHYNHYKGELHIILKDMPNEGNKNLVGRLSKDEMIMLEFIEPWRPFKII